MRTPCEFVVKLVLPAFRAAVAKELIEKHGFTQQRAAEILGVKQSNISYYLNSKRGAKYLSDLKLIAKREIVDIAGKIARDNASPLDVVSSFCEFCHSMRNEGKVCEQHKKQVMLPEDCNICIQ